MDSYEPLRAWLESLFPQQCHKIYTHRHSVPSQDLFHVFEHQIMPRISTLPRDQLPNPFESSSSFYSCLLDVIIALVHDRMPGQPFEGIELTKFEETIEWRETMAARFTETASLGTNNNPYVIPPDPSPPAGDLPQVSHGIQERVLRVEHGARSMEASDNYNMQQHPEAVQVKSEESNGGGQRYVEISPFNYFPPLPRVVNFPLAPFHYFWYGR